MCISYFAFDRSVLVLLLLLSLFSHCKYTCKYVLCVNRGFNNWYFSQIGPQHFLQFNPLKPATKLESKVRNTGSKGRHPDKLDQVCDEGKKISFDFTVGVSKK